MERHRHDLDELRRRYEAGASLRTLAKDCGVCLSTVHRWLQRTGTAFRSKGGPNYKGVLECRTRRLLGERELLVCMSAPQIAKRYRLDLRYTYRLLKEHGIEYARRW